MGMNYYLRKKCKCCEQEQQVHLGKSSKGWQFTFRGDRANGVVDFPSWVERVNTLMKSDWKLTDEWEGGTCDWTELLLKIQRKRIEPNNHAKEFPSELDYVDADGNSFSDREFC